MLLSEGSILPIHENINNSDFITPPSLYLKDKSGKYGFELALDIEHETLIFYYSTSRSNAVNGDYDKEDHNISFTFQLKN